MIVWEPRERIARAIYAQIRDCIPSEAFLQSTRDYRVIGFCNRPMTLVGGVVYFHFADGRVHVTGAGLPGWLNPERVRAIFEYGFIELDRDAMIALAAKSNKRSRRFVERLGFRECGRLSATKKRKAEILYEMTRDECRWLKGRENGQSS